MNYLTFASVTAIAVISSAASAESTGLLRHKANESARLILAGSLAAHVAFNPASFAMHTLPMGE